MDSIYKNANPPTLEPRALIHYVDSDGVLVRNVQIEPIMIRESSDLGIIGTDFAPGSMAFIAGGSAKWQLSASGEWVPWIG